jgi:hypothetical protein
MKLYELSTCGEKEWIAANTIIEALQVYHHITGNTPLDLDSVDDINEVPEEKWKDIALCFPDDKDEPDITFAERMKEVTKPEYLASTCY